MRTVAKAVGAAASLLLTAVTILLIKLTIGRARLPYENGRYYDSADSVVYDEGAVAVYGLLALVSALATAFVAWRTVRLWKIRSP